jgi:acetyl-CoA carboxylase biotin carboxyl carrier protein
MSLTPNEIRQVLDILAASAWDEAVVTVGDVTIAVARNGATLPTAGPASAPAPAPAPAATPAGPTVAVAAPAAAALAAPTAGGTDITSPSVGVFWRAPEPGAAPFVEVGQRVEVGQELCIVEVMKLMNRVPSTVAGVVTAVHVGNGDAVEFGTALFTIAAE